MRRRGHKFAGAREQRATAERSPAPRGWAVLGVEQPVIGPETPMKPDGMVEAREHEGRIENEAAMGDQRGIEQGEIGGIGKHALVQSEVVAKGARRPDPHLLRGRALFRAEVAGKVDRPDLDRPLAFPIGFHLRRQAIEQELFQFGLARQGLRCGHLRHFHLVRQTLLLLVEGGCHGEDRLPVLDRHHAAGGKAAAVADAVDIVDDRHRGIAGAQEIAVQGMGGAAIDRAAGRDQRLTDHLPTEHALPAGLGATPRNEFTSSVSMSRMARSWSRARLMGLRSLAPGQFREAACSRVHPSPRGEGVHQSPFRLWWTGGAIWTICASTPTRRPGCNSRLATLPFRGGMKEFVCVRTTSTTSSSPAAALSA